MADPDISVIITALIDGFKQGMQEAAAEARKTSESMDSSFKKMNDAGDRSRGKMETALDLGIFLALREVATSALNAVTAAFDRTAGAALDYADANEKFARQMGTNVSEAASLRAALEGSGTTADTFAQVVMKLNGNLAGSRERMLDLVPAFRNGAAEQMTQVEAMQAAIAEMAQYQEGYHQNQFAMEVFGQSALKVIEIQKGLALASEMARVQQEAGVDTSAEAAQRADSLQRSMTLLRAEWDANMVALGQRLLPVMERFIGWIGGEGRSTIEGFATLLKGIAVLMLGIGTAVTIAGTAVGSSIASMITAWVGYGKVVYEVLTGQFTAAWNTAKTTLDLIVQNTADAAAGIKSIRDGAGDLENALWGGGAAGGASAGTAGGSPTGGKKFTPAPDAGDKAAAERRKREAQQLAEELIDFDRRMALAEIDIAEEKNNQLHELDQQTNEDYYRQAERLAESRYIIERESLQQKADLLRGDVVAHQRALSDIEVLEQQHALTVDQIRNEASQRERDRLRRDADFRRQLSEDERNDEIDGIDFAQQMGEMSAREASRRKIASLEAGRRAEERFFDGQMAGKEGTDEYSKLMQRRVQTTRRFNQQITQLNRQTALQQRRQWQTLSRDISRAFTNSLRGMIQGTMTWKQAVGNLIAGVGNAFLDMGMKILEDWLQTMLMKALFTKTTETATNASTIMSHAAVAGAGAYAATAAIPYIGPVMAPGAAASAYSAAAAFAPLASAAGGMVLDSDRLVSAHKEEMILPANLSKGMQEIIANGGTGKGGSTFTYAPSVSAPQDASLDRMLKEQGQTMRRWLRQQERDGHLSWR